MSIILLKGLHSVKAINVIISLSLQKSKLAPERYHGKNVMFALIPR